MTSFTYYITNNSFHSVFLAFNFVVGLIFQNLFDIIEDVVYHGTNIYLRCVLWLMVHIPDYHSYAHHKWSATVAVNCYCCYFSCFKVWGVATPFEQCTESILWDFSQARYDFFVMSSPCCEYLLTFLIILHSPNQGKEMWSDSVCSPHKNYEIKIKDFWFQFFFNLYSWNAIFAKCGNSLPPVTSKIGFLLYCYKYQIQNNHLRVHMYLHELFRSF